MPIHVAISIRAREEALETAGLIKSLDSVGVSNEVSAESAGLKTRVYPATEYKFDGVDYVPSAVTAPPAKARAV